VRFVHSLLLLFGKGTCVLCFAQLHLSLALDLLLFQLVLLLLKRPSEGVGRRVTCLSTFGLFRGKLGFLCLKLASFLSDLIFSFALVSRKGKLLLSSFVLKLLLLLSSFSGVLWVRANNVSRFLPSLLALQVIYSLEDELPVTKRVDANFLKIRLRELRQKVSADVIVLKHFRVLTSRL